MIDTIKNNYYKIAVKVSKLLYLNILWVLFMILGIGIFGLFPSTTAMFSVTRKWTLGESEIPIFKTFWETYKKDFFKSNGYGYIFIIIGYLLLVSYRILLTQQSMPYIIGGYIIMAMLLVCLIAITYFFPLYVHFDLRRFEYIKWSFIVGLNHPTLTIIIVAGTTLLNYLLFKYIPGISLFLGGSLTAYIINWGISKIYPLYSDPKADELKIIKSV